MLEPLNGNVILEKVKESNVTESGIILSSKKEEDYYVVYGVGKEVNSIKRGDKVIAKKFAGTEFVYENKEYLVIDQKDILVVIG